MFIVHWRIVVQNIGMERTLLLESQKQFRWVCMILPFVWKNEIV